MRSMDRSCSLQNLAWPLVSKAVQEQKIYSAYFVVMLKIIALYA